MAKKKPSARKKTNKPSPFAQGKKHLTDARSLAKNDHYGKAWVVVQDAVAILKPLAAKGATSHILAYIDALNTAGLLALTLDLPNKSIKLLNECVSLVMKNTKDEPQVYADTMVAAMINLSQVLGHTAHDGFADKAVDYMKLTVDLLADLNANTSPAFTMEYYEAICGMIDALNNVNRVEQSLSYFDSLHTIAQSLPLLKIKSLAINYGYKCLQHASFLLSCRAHDKAISMAQKTQQIFDDLFTTHQLDHRLESVMAQLLQAEAYFGLGQYKTVAKQLAILEATIKTLYRVSPDALTNIYVQQLMLWGDVLVRLGNDDTGAEKFEQTLSILDENANGDSADNDILRIDLYWRIGLIHIRQSNTDVAVEILLKAITVDKALQKLADNPLSNQIIISVRHALIPSLIMTQQWAEAVYQSQCLMQNEHHTELINGDIYKSFKAEITTLSEDLADEPQAVDCCRQVIKALAPLCGELE